MKKIILIVFGVFAQMCYSQKTDGICYDSDFFGVPVKEVEYIRHKNGIVKDRYVRFTEVKNTSPKELIKSMISAKNNKWVSYNYGKEMKWSQDQLDRLNGSEKYIELLCEINIVINNVSYSIIKVNSFDGNKKPQFLSLVLKKIENRWVVNSDKILSDLNFLIMFTSVDDIDAIFNNTKTNNEKLNGIIKNSWNKKTLDLSKILSELGSMMLNQEYKSLPTENNNTNSKEGNKKISVIYNYPLSNQKFCYYFSNEISNYKEEELNSILNFIKSKQVENLSIVPIHKFSYLRNNKKIDFFKYKIKNAVNGEVFKTEQFVVNNNNVSLLEGKNSIVDNVFEIIRNLKSEAIIQFSNGENKSGFPEINKLKPLVKDANGVINIEKLAKVIKENKSTLSKYLEE
jgi:hypothetical protein